MKFRPSQRIRRHADFLEVYEHGARAQSRFYTLFVRPNQLATGRLGIAATRKLGGAAVRNRVKRVVREVFRRNDIAAGFDIVVVPRRELIGVDLSVLESDYRATLERRIKRRP